MDHSHKSCRTHSHQGRQTLEQKGDRGGHPTIPSRAQKGAPSNRLREGAPRLCSKLSDHQKPLRIIDRKSTRLNSSHLGISYAVFCLKKKKNEHSYTYEAISTRIFCFPLPGHHIK